MRLILDTGAVLTTLHPSIATSIGYTERDSIKPTTIQTATAVEHGYMLHVQELSSLGFRMRNAPVDVADLGHDIDGLLGMSFLQHFNFEIRPFERCILVGRIAP